MAIRNLPITKRTVDLGGIQDLKDEIGDTEKDLRRVLVRNTTITLKARRILLQKFTPKYVLQPRRNGSLYGRTGPTSMQEKLLTLFLGR